MGSKYAVAWVGDSVRGEHTNIGIVVFDDNGDQRCRRIAKLDRAKARGDCPTDFDEKRLDDWLGSIQTVKQLERLHESFGHAMSINQVGELCGSLLSPERTLDSAWDTLIRE